MSGMHVSCLFGEYSIFDSGHGSVVQSLPSLGSARKVSEPRCLVYWYLVVRSHVARVPHIGSVRCYELEEKLRVRILNYCRGFGNRAAQLD